MPGYPMMELARREPIHLGEMQYWRVYWKYPDGRKVPFKTDTWDGIQPVEVKRVRRIVVSHPGESEDGDNQ